LDLREVVFLDGAALGARPKPSFSTLKKAMVSLCRQGICRGGRMLVLHPGVGIETARREGDDGDEGVFDELFRRSL